MSSEDLQASHSARGDGPLQTAPKGGNRPCAYIFAGPITGYDLAERVETFAKKAAMLRQAGYDVVNPFDLHPLGVPWAEALRADIKGLSDCMAIYLQKGWEKSRGVALELTIALALGLEVILDASE